MKGASIEAVERGVEFFVQETMADTFAKETVHVGVILFGGTASMATEGLVPVTALTPPKLTAAGNTPLGAAFGLLDKSLDSDYRANVPGQEKGDWKPLVFILTDGEPTDDWEGPRRTILARQSGKVLNVITVGCGPLVNQELLERIAVGATFQMDGSEASFQKFFRWVTQSVQRAAKQVSGEEGAAAPKEMPAPPEGLVFIPQYNP